MREWPDRPGQPAIEIKMREVERLMAAGQTDEARHLMICRGGAYRAVRQWLVWKARYVIAVGRYDPMIPCPDCQQLGGRHD